jgi:integrase
MTKRRAKGDGGLRWSESRQRWIGELTIGYTPAGKRIVRSASRKNKGDARDALNTLIRNYEDGLATAATSATVADAVTDFLTYGLNGRSPTTITTATILADQHIIPAIGARKLRVRAADKRQTVLSADDVDEWLSEKAKTLATETLRDLLSILRRSLSRAQARDKVDRNVALLCELPKGQPGRPSKSLSFDQAEAILAAAEADDSTIGAYIVVSLLAGGRTEEMRPLLWSHVDLAGKPDAEPPVPPTIMVWRSVRVGNDTKTQKSRRTLALPARCVAALEAQRVRQDRQRTDRLDGPGRSGWTEHGLVFASEVGTLLSAANVRRAFRRVLKAAGLVADDWTPRELRHSFVSLLSDDGVPIEQISRLVGHSSTKVTETVYRHQIRPVVQDGATAIDRLFPGSPMA